jgi:hypothetical protein
MLSAVEDVVIVVEDILIAVLPEFVVATVAAASTLVPKMNPLMWPALIRYPFDWTVNGVGAHAPPEYVMGVIT